MQMSSMKLKVEKYLQRLKKLRKHAFTNCWKIKGCVGSVVARSTEDREVPGWNPTLAEREFLWVQDMNLRGST